MVLCLFFYVTKWAFSTSFLALGDTSRHFPPVHFHALSALLICLPFAFSIPSWISRAVGPFFFCQKESLFHFILVRDSTLIFLDTVWFSLVGRGCLCEVWKHPWLLFSWKEFCQCNCPQQSYAMAALGTFSLPLVLSMCVSRCSFFLYLSCLKLIQLSASLGLCVSSV